MRVIFLISLFLFSTNSFANLYLTTEYREGNNLKISTKQHIFLDQRYPVNYSRKGYILILKKITATEATIETETYDINKIGHKTMEGGSYGTYRVGSSFTIKSGTNNRIKYFLKISLEKVVLPKN